MRLTPDTSAYSHMVKGHREILRTIEMADEVWVSPIVLGELKSGFIRGNRRRENEAALQRFLESPNIRVLRIDRETAECYAEIHAGLRSTGTPIPANDIWIAASALQHGLRVVTSDQHFRLVPQILVDSYEG